MKTLNLKIDLSKLNLGPEDKAKNPVEVAGAVISNVILNYAQQVRGLDEKERRQFYKISDAIDEAKKNNKDEILLEDDWAGFLRKCFRESKLSPNELLRQVEDLIIGLKDN